MNWGLLRAVRDRIEANCLPRGILYPWWVPVISFGGQLACVVMALFLRDALWTPDLLILTIPLVLVAPVVQLGFGRWLPWWLDSLPALVAAGWLISVAPDLGTAPIDAAPGLLAFVVAEITARDGLRPGIAVGGFAYGILAAGAVFGPGVVGVPVHAILLEIGFVVGAMLLWQMRALVAERGPAAGDLGAGDHRRAGADRPRDPRPGRALAERHPAAHHRRPARTAGRGDGCRLGRRRGR